MDTNSLGAIRGLSICIIRATYADIIFFDPVRRLYRATNNITLSDVM